MTIGIEVQPDLEGHCEASIIPKDLPHMEARELGCQHASIHQLLVRGCTKGISTSRYLLCGQSSASSPRAVLQRQPIVPTVGNQITQRLKREHPEPVKGRQRTLECVQTKNMAYLTILCKICPLNISPLGPFV